MNANLHTAKAAKNDEFYTQYADIEKEIMAYLEFDSNAFRGKTVLLPCDDPEWSNFTKFFAQKFTMLGLKKLISTSYNKEGKPAKVYTLLPGADVNGDGKTDFHDMEKDELEGNGDFRNDETCALLAEADIVVTNPPFSLFREFLAWVIEADKKFLMVGNMNAVTYKETFPLIKNNKLWYGPSISSGDRAFNVPDNYPLDAAGCGIDANGQRFIRVKGVRWFTNLDHGRRHEPLMLSNMADNLRYDKNLAGMTEYATYDNYNAIEIPKTKLIPSDYAGVMGVPITFLDKYNPEQFEILGITESNGKGASNGLWTGGTAQPTINQERKYVRIFIKHRNPTK